MKLKILLPYVKYPKKIFKVDKSFKTRSEVTKRTIQIAEAFGLGIDEEKEFIVVKGFKVDINPGDIVLLVGDSGGGKSVLLRELCTGIERDGGFGSVLEAQGIQIDSDEVLIEGVGEDAHDAVRILSMTGLNEAFLMLRRYRELSDGQKYRYRLAKAIDSKADVWVFDEFLATLDRVTAKVVAYCIQKTTRRLKKTVLTATTHRDLIDDFNPDLIIDKGFGRSVKVDRRKNDLKECSILKDIVIKRASKNEFLASDLKDFHYRREGFGGIAPQIFMAYLNGEAVGAIIYVYPHFHLRGRHLALPHYKDFRQQYGYKALCALINREIRRISRVIAHPKYRSIGLGVKLVKETMPLVNVPYIETLAVMAKYNPFFQKAEMIPIHIPEDLEWKRILERLEALGFNIQLLPSKKCNLNAIKRLNSEQLQELSKIILNHIFADKFRQNKELESRIKLLDPDAIAEGLKQHRLPAQYLIWKNPAFTNYPDPRLPADVYSNSGSKK